MVGRPGGNLERTYEWSMEALRLDEKKRYSVDCLHELKGKFDLKKYNIFWFYAKAFHPDIYLKIKELRPDAKYICGPNIMLDKPDIGLSDDWDTWYVNHCRPDIHLDQVHFYQDHVKKFLHNSVKANSRCLNKCIKLDENLYEPDTVKKYDCLIYSKKRRYDKKFEDFRYNLLLLLDKNNISYCEIPAGKFGTYERKDYFNLLNKSKVMVNLSLDECPGILNYESMFINVPVIGSPHNVPITSCKELHVIDTDKMTDSYLVRKDDAPEKYFKKIQSFLNGKIKINTSHRDWILKETSFQKYCNKLNEILEELSW